MTLDKIAPGEKVARERGIKVEEKCGGSRKEGRKEEERERGGDKSIAYAFLLPLPASRRARAGCLNWLRAAGICRDLMTRGGTFQIGNRLYELEFSI